MKFKEFRPMKWPWRPLSSFFLMNRPSVPPVLTLQMRWQHQSEIHCWKVMSGLDLKMGTVNAGCLSPREYSDVRNGCRMVP